MKKIEKLGLKYILQFLVDANDNFNKANDESLSDLERDDAWSCATSEIKAAIDSLVSAINEE